MSGAVGSVREPIALHRPPTAIAKNTPSLASCCSEKSDRISYRTHLTSLRDWIKVHTTLESRYHEVFQQPYWCRMGNSWTAVASDITSEEADTTLRLDKARAPRRHPLSTQERLQLGRLAQRLASLLNRLLALQTVAKCRCVWATHEYFTSTSAWAGKKKPKWTTLIIIDSQAVKNTCNASVSSKGFCFYKATNGIKRHLAVDTLGFPFFTHCTKANVSDDAGLLEMLMLNIDYFKSKPVNIPKITILLDHGYHIDYLIEALQKVYPQIMTKIRFELSAKPSKQQKAAQGKSGFVPVVARWVIERSNAWMERCKSLVKNFERTLSHATTKINLCFVRLMLKRLAATSWDLKWVL